MGSRASQRGDALLGSWRVSESGQTVALDRLSASSRPSTARGAASHSLQPPLGARPPERLPASRPRAAAPSRSLAAPRGGAPYRPRWTRGGCLRSPALPGPARAQRANRARRRR
ncbi:unnamed protein product [Prorocentrum cordatum]|uniref:Uncharacterized protein n=1 Tax=Prorocentrum cordatum TaxID=2364126 RepID=A0ABN9TJX6_9DINO|nr:unnamed protein product [Polarella glacialis]